MGISKPVIAILAAACFSASLSFEWALSLEQGTIFNAEGTTTLLSTLFPTSPSPPSLSSQDSSLHLLLTTAWDTLPPLPNNGADAAATAEWPNRVLTNVLQSAAVATDDVVMLTHISMAGRLHNLLIQLRWWNGPAAVAVHVKSRAEVDRFGAWLVPQLRALALPLQVHVVLENVPSSSSTSLGYPHNWLRNIVLDHLRSDFFVAMDADFVTNPNAHSALTSLIHNDTELRQRLRSGGLFVLPAFELLEATNDTATELRQRLGSNGGLFALPTLSETNTASDNNHRDYDSPQQQTAESRLPRTKAELLALLRTPKLDTFHSFNPAGHEATNFDKWATYNVSVAQASISSGSTDNNNNRTAGAAMQHNRTHNETAADVMGNAVLDYDSFFAVQYRGRFEPYVLGYRHAMPRYWKGFRGFGFNKVTWFQELHRLGLPFFTLVDFFVVHLNHAIAHDANQRFMEANSKEYVHFGQYQDRRFGRPKRQNTGFSMRVAAARNRTRRSKEDRIKLKQQAALQLLQRAYAQKYSALQAAAAAARVENKKEEEGKPPAAAAAAWKNIGAAAHEAEITRSRFRKQFEQHKRTAESLKARRSNRYY